VSNGKVDGDWYHGICIYYIGQMVDVPPRSAHFHADERDVFLMI